MPVNENQETLRTLAQIYLGLNEIQAKGEEIIFDTSISTQDKMVFLIWYYFRLAQLKKELDQLKKVSCDFIQAIFLQVMESCNPQVGPNKARVFLLYLRNWHFCKYLHKYKPQKVIDEKNTFMRD